MAETAPAPAVSTAKAPKKKSAAKARKSGPSVSDLIVKAVTASQERKGMSLAALKKALAGGGYDVEKNNSRVKLALKSLVKKGSLVQTKGTGASGSFKVSKGGAVTKPAKKPAPKKPAAKAAKPKKSPAKKPAAKKAPKKVKKPAAAAAKKAVKSPKKAKKPAAKKVTKSPSKKVKAAKPKAAKPKASKAKKTSAKKK